MKLKIILFSLGLFLFTSIGFAQKKKAPKSFISEKVTIKKYHNKGELERMQKGELIVLYSERIEVLVRTLPYVAFATKPGITMSSLKIFLFRGFSVCLSPPCTLIVIHNCLMSINI